MSHPSSKLKPLRWYRELATGKGRRESGVFLVEGARAVRQVAQTSPDSIMEIITAEGLPPEYAGYPAREVTGPQFRSIAATKTPQGLLAVVRMPAEASSDLPPEPPGNRILLLEDVQDPGNVGTLIRTAAAFDYAGVILTEKCADPFAPKTVQATAGTVLSVWIRRTGHYLELVTGLKKRGYFLVATELGGSEDTDVLCGRENLLLALGNEASGLSGAILNAADFRLRVPTQRVKAESLNVAACGAICMYLSAQKRNARP